MQLNREPPTAPPPFVIELLPAKVQFLSWPDPKKPPPCGAELPSRTQLLRVTLKAPPPPSAAELATITQFETEAARPSEHTPPPRCSPDVLPAIRVAPLVSVNPERLPLVV